MKGIYSLSADETADFEIHLSDMLNLNSAEKYSVINEVSKIKNSKLVCFLGDEESETVRKKFEASGIKVITLTGDHHFNNNFNSIVNTVLKINSSTK